MDTWNAIISRQDVRNFSDEEIPRPQVEKILEAGRRAPSSQNWQPWGFVVVTDRDQLASLSKVWKFASQVADSAATVALIISDCLDDRSRMQAHYDLGQAMLQMMLAATSLGIGSGHTVVGDQELAQQVLGFPDGSLCAYLMPLGFPADGALQPIDHPDRRSFDEVVHWRQW